MKHIAVVKTQESTAQKKKQSFKYAKDNEARDKLVCVVASSTCYKFSFLSTQWKGSENNTKNTYLSCCMISRFLFPPYMLLLTDLSELQQFSVVSNARGRGTLWSSRQITTYRKNQRYATYAIATRYVKFIYICCFKCIPQTLLGLKWKSGSFCNINCFNFAFPLQWNSY